ncbi:MAG TPA: hypothetical protein VFC63_08525 [Blastocatellia bacterium]|nr:hypothetical protein [Blastocatellia bacterium]
MIRKSLILGTLLLGMVGSVVFAQSPTPRLMHFSINVPYKLRMGDYMLPAGKYDIIQAFKDDANLYYLHPVDLTHAPIAVIRTARIRNNGSINPTPESSEMLVRMREDTSGNAIPVIRGWTFPGEDGWQIISVTPKKNSPLVRVSS